MLQVGHFRLPLAGCQEVASISGSWLGTVHAESAEGAGEARGVDRVTSAVPVHCLALYNRRPTPAAAPVPCRRAVRRQPVLAACRRRHQPGGAGAQGRHPPVGSAAGGASLCGHRCEPG
jgi:hypothetical protein